MGLCTWSQSADAICAVPMGLCTLSESGENFCAVGGERTTWETGELTAGWMDNTENKEETHFSKVGRLGLTFLASSSRERTLFLCCHQTHRSCTRVVIRNMAVRRERDRERETETETERQRERETERERDRQTDRETERDRERERERRTDRQTEKDRQRDRERQRERETDRQTDRDRETETQS